MFVLDEKCVEIEYKLDEMCVESFIDGWFGGWSVDGGGVKEVDVDDGVMWMKECVDNEELIELIDKKVEEVKKMVDGVDGRWYIWGVDVLNMDRNLMFLINEEVNYVGMCGDGDVLMDGWFEDEKKREEVLKKYKDAVVEI
jgi:hypothetical protein